MSSSFQPEKFEEQLIKLRDGLRGLPRGTQVTIGGVSRSAEEVARKLDAYIASYEAVRATRVLLDQQTAARNGNQRLAKTLREDIEPGIRSLVGPRNPELTKFGFKPKKAPRKLTSDAQSKKVERMRATRQARGTRGPRQKLGIKGAIDGPSVRASPPQTQGANGVAR